MQSGIRDVTVRAGAAVRDATGPAWMTVLCAGALAPLVVAELDSDAGDETNIDVIRGAMGNNLSSVISSTVDHLRQEDAEAPSLAEAEDKLTAQIETALDSAEGERLRKEIATLLRETGAAREALEAATESGDADLKAAVIARFGDLVAEFPEFEFVVADIPETADRVRTPDVDVLVEDDHTTQIPDKPGLHADPDMRPDSAPTVQQLPVQHPTRPRRRGRLVAAIVVLSLVAAGLAIRTSLVASEQRDSAVSRQLVAESAALAATDPTRSQLLAAAAWQVSANPKARIGMLRALATSASRTTAGNAVAFNTDGSTLATGGSDGVVRLWDTATAEPGATFRLRDPVLAVGFGSDVQAAGVGNGVLWVWHKATGLRTPLRTGVEEVTAMAFSPDGKALATVTDGGKVTLWDAAKGTSKELSKKKGSIEHLAFSPDGKTLATGDAKGHVKFWKTKKGAKSHSLAKRKAFAGSDHNGVTALAFSPDGKLFADGGSDGIVRLWKAEKRKSITAFSGAEGVVGALGYSPDGSVLAVAGSNGTVSLWDTDKLTRIGDLPGNTKVGALAFSPDGARLATGGEVARLWDTPIGNRSVASKKDGTDAVLSSSGDTVAVLQSGNQLQLWDAVAGKPGAAIEDKEVIAVKAVAVSPDGATLALTDGQAGVRIWDAASGKVVRTVAISTKVNTLASGPDDMLALGGGNGTVWLWNAASGKKVRVLKAGKVGIGALAFSQDGATLAASAWNGTVWLWNARTGEKVSEADGLGFGDSSLAFSPDGDLVAQGTADGVVRVIDTASGEEISRLSGRAETAPPALAFGPDGTTLVTGDADGAVRLWDAESGEQITDLTGQSGRVAGLAVRGDGTLVSVGADATVWSWDLSYLKDPYETLCDRAGRSLSRAEWQQHLPDLPFQQVCAS